MEELKTPGSLQNSFKGASHLKLQECIIFMHYRIEALIYVCTGTEKLHGVTFKPDISLRFVFFVCIVYAS